VRTVAIALTLLVSAIVPAAAQERIVVFAASSLQTALDAAADAWTEETDDTVVISYAATSALARQIDQGAPADLFISADRDWMDWLEERRLIDSASRTDLFGNRLVLVAPDGPGSEIEIGPGLDLSGLLGDGRLAIADTAAVPAGRYAREALETLGLWDQVAGRLAPAENVRAALAFVSRGETPFGIVYATDDVADPGVVAIGAFPESAHAPIVYLAALVAESDNDAAAAVLDWLATPPAQCIFLAQGFSVLGEGGGAGPDCVAD